MRNKRDVPYSCGCCSSAQGRNDKSTRAAEKRAVRLCVGEWVVSAEDFDRLADIEIERWKDALRLMEDR